MLLLLATAGMFLESATAATEARLVASPEIGWPQFRGPRRDGVSDERGLMQRWPEGGPRALWSVTNLGRGFSSPIVVGERIFITGDIGGHLAIHALDLGGHTIWRATNGASWKDPYPGARASVTFSGGRLYHENAHGRVACLEAASGREWWAVEVLQTFGGSNITWGLSECLAVDERAVFVTAGGPQTLMVALNKTNGAVLWKSPPLRAAGEERTGEDASYVSPILIEQGTRRLLIGCSLRHAFAVDAANGSLLWTQPMRTTYAVLALTPALVNDGVFMTAPHGSGGRLWRLPGPGRNDFPEIWSAKLDTCQGGVVARDGKIFGSFYGGRKGWAALDARTGGVLYQAEGMTKGAPLFADGRIYALSEDGWMRLLEPTAKEFVEQGKFRFTTAHERDAWAHPVVLNGRLYLRHHDRLACFEVRR